ncbi:hypothetical protein ACHAWF_006895, partial [Thalassiosira exigua]
RPCGLRWHQRHRKPREPRQQPSPFASYRPFGTRQYLCPPHPHIDTMPDDATSKKRKGGEGASNLSKQEKNERRILANDKRVQLEQFEHLLKVLKDSPEKYKREEHRFIREFVDHVERHKDIFPVVMGDRTFDPTAEQSVGAGIELSDGYISALAKGRTDVAEAFPTPILQVVARETKYREISFAAASFKNGRDNNEQVPVKFTHLRLRDGDSNTILGRVTIHMTEESRKLGPGDIIVLKLFTEVNHKVTERSSPKPALFITNYSRIAYTPLPDSNEIKDPIVCETECPEAEVPTSGNSQRHLENVHCTYDRRLCSIHGVSMIKCICDTNPVASLDLQTVKEDCYFATKEIEDMTNSHKRCMIYWWYATNIYSICGKGRRLMLPDCLVQAVRNEYPEPDGNFTGFSF